MKQAKADPKDADDVKDSEWARKLLSFDELEALQARQPKNAEEATELLHEFEKEFTLCAGRVMNETALMIAGQPYRILELEFYYNGGSHKDPFAHCDPNQRQSGTFYFHRQNGKAFKGGSFKGLDISIGGQGDPAAYGGALIRAIEPFKGSDPKKGSVIEGPCKVVDTILEKTGHKDISALVNNPQFAGDNEAPRIDHHGSCFYMAPVSTLDFKVAPCDVVGGPRFGLTLKKIKEEGHPFLMRPYRFLAKPQFTKKGSPNLILALHHVRGLDVAGIRAITGNRIQAKSIQTTVDAFENAKKGKATAASFHGKELSGAEWQACYGVLAREGFCATFLEVKAKK